jgi:hypothetical protein
VPSESCSHHLKFQLLLLLLVVVPQGLPLSVTKGYRGLK